MSIERTANAVKELVMEIDKKATSREISKKVVEEMGKYLEDDIYDLQ